MRTVWPQGVTQPAGVAPEVITQTDDGALGEVGSQGVAQAPMADTHTAGTVEHEVQAGTSDAEGCGMATSEDFEIFEETAVLDLGVDGLVADGPGLAAAGESDNTGRCTDAARAEGTPITRTTTAAVAQMAKWLTWMYMTLAHAPTPRSLRAGQPSMCRRPTTPRRSASEKAVAGTLTLRGTGGKLQNPTPRRLRRASWAPMAPARQQQGEVATRARTPPPSARVPRVAQRSTAAAGQELKWPTRV